MDKQIENLLVDTFMESSMSPITVRSPALVKEIPKEAKRKILQIVRDYFLNQNHEYTFL